MNKTIFSAFSLLCCTVIIYSALLGSMPVASAATVSAEIVGVGDKSMTVALAAPSGVSNNSRSMIQAIKTNLAIVPFLRTLDAAGIPGGGQMKATGEGANFRGFLMAGAQLVVTSHWVSEEKVELRVFDAGSGSRLLGNAYDVSGTDGVANMADIFCDDLLKSIIGKSALFRSSIAFVKSGGKHKKDIWSVKANGRNLQQLTNMKGEALSPTWSYDNRRIVFSHIDKRSHGLGVWDASSRTSQRIKFAGNTVIGPCFMPDNRLAVSLTDGRNPSIFVLSGGFQKLGRLDNSGSIDVSPSFDASGTRMAFTSNRLGNPHIFVKDLQTGSVRRVSQGGAFNSDPSISPDGTVVVFARYEGSGHRIYAYDLVSGVERKITFGPGSDEAPAFASDGFFVAFTSSRNGKRQLFLTTRDGGTPRLIPTGIGDAFMAAWSKVRN